MNTKDMHDYAWNWFEYHAGQRLVAFRFFLIVLGALVLGISTGLKDENIVLASAIAELGVLISFAFLMLEVRNNRLVDVGREALKHLERSDESLKANPKVQLLCIDSTRNLFLSHKFWLRVIYVACIGLFLVVALNPTILLVPR
jgi:hypothetical protein